MGDGLPELLKGPYPATTAVTYASSRVAHAALTAADGDAEAAREFLASETVETIAGTYEANEKGQQVGFKYVGTQWQDRSKEIVWPADLATARPVVPKPDWS